MFSLIQAKIERAFPALKDKLLWRLVRTNLHEQRKPFFLYTGRGPSSEDRKSVV